MAYPSLLLHFHLSLLAVPCPLPPISCIFLPPPIPPSYDYISISPSYFMPIPLSYCISIPLLLHKTSHPPSYFNTHPSLLLHIYIFLLLPIHLHLLPVYPCLSPISYRLRLHIYLSLVLHIHPSIHQSIPPSYA